MNLHLVPDDKYINQFYDRIQRLGLGPDSKFIARTSPPFKYINESQIAGAEIGSPDFLKLTGPFSQYTKIFIHFMDERSIDLIVDNDLKDVYWLVWGGDVYESLFGSLVLLDPETEQLLGITPRNKINRFVYHQLEKLKKRKKYKSAYSRVKHVCCWIDGEYDHAIKHLPGLTASRKMFIYNQEISFADMAKPTDVKSPRSTGQRILLGQSAAAPNNHASALHQLAKSSANIDEVIIPISYGSMDYAKKLESWTEKQKFSFKITFLKNYQPFDQYLEVLKSIDVIILNSLRPAGMGNFWIGILLGKIVILRPENLAFQMLRKLGLTFFSPEEWKNGTTQLTHEGATRNRDICLEYYDEGRISKMYSDLFN